MKQATFTLWNLLAFLIRYETVFNLLNDVLQNGNPVLYIGTSLMFVVKESK